MSLERSFTALAPARTSTPATGNRLRVCAIAPNQATTAFKRVRLTFTAGRQSSAERSVAIAHSASALEIQNDSQGSLLHWIAATPIGTAALIVVAAPNRHV